ncbi:MAG: hypothetical protein ACI9XK_000853 [Granulosicoccus sp.]|jgi:hypothetical protein
MTEIRLIGSGLRRHTKRLEMASAHTAAQKDVLPLQRTHLFEPHSRFYAKQKHCDQLLCAGFDLKVILI